MMQAAKAGLGICALPYYIVFEDVQSDKLRIVLPKCCHRALEPFYACYPKSPYPSAKIEAFIETLREYLKEKYPKRGFYFNPSVLPKKRPASGLG